MNVAPTPPRVLIADDDDQFRRPLAELLRRQGCECVQASDGPEALAALEAGPFDLLISDIQMPGNSNLELVRRMAEVAPGLPVIVITGHPKIETAAASVQLPVVAYLTKPPSFDELWRVASKAIARRRDCREVSALRVRLTTWARELEQVEAQMKSGPVKADDSASELWSAITFRNALESLLDLKRLTDRRAAENPGGTGPDTILTEAIQTSIEVLEQTKQSFKSKRLADLRRHLEEVLEKRPAEHKNA